MSQATPTRPEAHLIGLSELVDEPAGSAKRLVGDLNPLHQIKATLQVCVGDVVVTVGELLGAKENQVLMLDRRIDEPVELMLEGKVVARGQLVAVDDNFAIQITELPISLNT